MIGVQAGCSAIDFRAFLHSDEVLEVVTETRVALGMRRSWWGQFRVAVSMTNRYRTSEARTRS